jgi:hypothetical protein
MEVGILVFSRIQISFICQPNYNKVHHLAPDLSTKCFFILGLDALLPLHNGQHIILDPRRSLYGLHV